VDVLAKEASIRDVTLNNNITCRKIISSLKLNYDMIDNQHLFTDRKSVGTYYLINFSDIKFPFIKKITKNKKECGSLSRIITGFPMTKTYLFKMKIANSLKCLCGTLNQDLNHLFWECPILTSERFLLYKILRKLNLMDSFSIEFV